MRRCRIHPASRPARGRSGWWVLGFLLLVPLPILAQNLISYPSYRPRFHAETESFTLRSSVYIVNTGNEKMEDLVLRQEVPEGITVESVDFGEQEGIRRPPGFSEKVEQNVYQMSIPVLRPKEGTLVLSEFLLDKRVWERTFPGILARYTVGGEPQEVRLPSVTYDLAMYSDHVGSLERFLKRYAKVSLELTEKDRKVWEFAQKDAAATGTNPSGIVSIVTEEDRKGYYRIRTGQPGDLLEIIVDWRPAEIRDRILDPKELVNRFEDYLRWIGDFRFQRSSLKLTKTKFLGYPDSRILEGRWKDQVANRLGEGPFRGIAFHSPREGVEYFLFLFAQARGFGPENSETPQPEREGELMEELTRYSKSFKSHIDPLSLYKR